MYRIYALFIGFMLVVLGLPAAGQVKLGIMCRSFLVP